jgi:hypothetical protein
MSTSFKKRSSNVKFENCELLSYHFGFIPQLQKIESLNEAAVCIKTATLQTK